MMERYLRKPFFDFPFSVPSFGNGFFIAFHTDKIFGSKPQKQELI